MSAVLRAAVDPNHEGEEVERLRARLARAGVLVAGTPPVDEPPAGDDALAAARRRAGRGRSLTDLGCRGSSLSVFADSSALVKLYADEDQHEAIRGLEAIAVSALARVEVAAAIWRKHRLGELDHGDAVLLVAAFRTDPSCNGFAAFDQVLREAAVLNGFALVPAAGR